MPLGVHSAPISCGRTMWGAWMKCRQRSPVVVEVVVVAVVDPNAVSSPLMALVIAVASPSLRTYFSTSGAG